MKKQLGRRVVSWLLAVGMMLSPVGAGVTAVPAFAEESSIVDTAEENTVPADENTDSEGTDENSDAEDNDVNPSEGSEESTAEITDEEDTASNENSDETPSLDYINSIPVTVNEKISAYYNTDGTNTVDLRTGNFVAVGNSISIGLSVNDYINHKVTINGEELAMYLNGDGFAMYAQYTVENVESLNIDLVESPWSEEMLSQYVTLDLGESVYVWYYNDYYQNTPAYAENGDYLAKGRYYYIDYYYTMFDEDAVLKINGTEVECEINEEYQLANYFFYLPEDADFDTLRVEVVTDNGDIPVTYGEKIRVSYSRTGEDEDRTFPTSGSTVPSEGFLYISADIADSIDHIITINGNEVPMEEWSPNGDECTFVCGYTIQETDTEIAIELIEKEWTDEYKSQYSVFEISSGLHVYYYNEFFDSIGNREAQNGDYIHKDAKFSVRYFKESLPDGHTITINGEEVEYTVNNDGTVQIWGYEVPDDSDVIKIVLTPPGDIPLSFDEETIRLFYNANTNYDTFYEDGDNVEAGTSIDINVDINDYINHKLMLNGEEIPLELTGDGTYFYGNYTVSEEDTQLEFVLEESQWTEEELSDFAVVEIDDYIQLYNYNEYYQIAITDYPLENGDYIYKGQKIVVRVPYLYYPDKAIIRINGKQMDCFVSYYSDWQIWAYEPYYTDNTLSVKFDNEFSAPVTGFTEMFVNSFYSLEEALDYYENVNAAITIYVNEPVEVSTLNLPKKAQKLTIDCIGTIKYNGKTLNIPCDTTIGCELITSAAVKVASGKSLTLEGAAKTLGAVSGAATSKLIAKTDVTASGLTTFGEVTVTGGNTLTVSGAVKGVGLLNGAIKLTNASATAAITKIGAAEIILVETDGKLPKTTVTNVNEALAVTVENETGKLASGTTILYTAKENYSDKVTIKNTAESGDELTAYYYAKTKSIKAEVGTALTLTYGDFEKSYPNFELLFADITDKNIDYTITVNTDLTLDAKFALPKTAKSITFTGDATLKFTGTKLTIPYDVTFGDSIDISIFNKKGTMDIAIGKDVTFTNNGTIRFTIGKLSGTKTSNLIGTFEVQNLATFDKVSGTVRVMGGKVTGINIFDGTLDIYGAKSTAAIKTVTVNSIIHLIKDNGVLPKVTLEGIGEAIDNDTTIDVFVKEGFGPGYTVLESGTAILYTKKDNFADKIDIRNNNDEMKAYCYGKTIKAEYPGAVIVSTDPDSEEDDKDYPNFELAVAEIDAAKDNNAEYVITIKKDIAPAKFTLPKYAKSVKLTVDGDTRTIDIGKATAITANTDLTIQNIRFVTTGKSLTITAKKNLTVIGLYGNVTAIKGGAKSVLNWNGEAADTAKADITGFGTVNVSLLNTLTTGKVFNVTKLVLAPSAKLVVSAETTKSSIKALEALSSNSAIRYEEGAKALTFTGKDTDFTGTLKITGEVANGQAVLTTKTVSVDKLTNGIAPANEDVEYGFVQVGKDICYMGKVLEVTSTVGEEEPTELGAYATWGEVVEVIEEAKDAEAAYTITLLDDYNANSAIKFPKAGTYKSIEITSAQDDDAEEIKKFNFNFTGNFTLTGDTTFVYVNLGAVKNGTRAKYTINAGKNCVTIASSDTGMLTSVTGTEIALYGVENVINADKIKATANLYLSGDVKAIGGITTRNVLICDNTNLVMNQGSKLAITGGVEDAYGGNSKITITILDKNGNVAALKKGYVVATIKGTYAENSIVLDEAHEGFALELINGKLVVV